MIISSKLKKFLEEAKKKDSYWVEHAKLDFSVAMESERKKAGMTYKDIASKIAATPAYITKVFRGDSNLTIESMVKLARAVGCKLEIKIVAQESTAQQWGSKLTVIKGGLMPRATGASVVINPGSTYRTTETNTLQKAA